MLYCSQVIVNCTCTRGRLGIQEDWESLAIKQETRLPISLQGVANTYKPSDPRTHASHMGSQSGATVREAHLSQSHKPRVELSQKKRRIWIIWVWNWVCRNILSGHSPSGGKWKANVTNACVVVAPEPQSCTPWLGNCCDINID